VKSLDCFILFLMKRFGFTLLEISVVVVVIGLLTVMAVWNYGRMASVAEYRNESALVLSFFSDVRANAMSQKSCDQSGAVESYAWFFEINKTTQTYRVGCMVGTDASFHEYGTEGNEDNLHADIQLSVFSVHTRAFAMQENLALNPLTSDVVRVLFVTEPYLVKLQYKDSGGSFVSPTSVDVLWKIGFEHAVGGAQKEQSVLCIDPRFGLPSFSTSTFDCPAS